MNTPDNAMRAEYAKTALARMGIPYERAIQSRAVREFIERAAAGRHELKRAA